MINVHGKFKSDLEFRRIDMNNLCSFKNTTVLDQFSILEI